MDWTGSDGDNPSKIPAEPGCPSQTTRLRPQKPLKPKHHFHDIEQRALSIPEPFSNFQLPQMERAQTAAGAREVVVLEPSEFFPLRNF